jgi:hypothetical protein
MCPKRLEFSFGIFEQMMDGAKPAMSISDHLKAGLGRQQPYSSIQYCTFCIGLQATTVLWLKLSNMPSVRRGQSAKANLSYEKTC